MVAPRSIYHGKQKEAYPHSKVKNIYISLLLSAVGFSGKNSKVRFDWRRNTVRSLQPTSPHFTLVHVRLVSTENWKLALRTSSFSPNSTAKRQWRHTLAPCSPALYVYVYQPIPFHPGSPTPVPLPRHIQIVRNLCKGFFTCMQIQQTVFASQIISDKSRPHNLVLLDPIGTS